MSGPSIYGSSEAEILTFNVGYAGAIGYYGGDGNDSVTSATGADVLRGDNGNDSLSGLGGNDQLTGGAGADILKGGAGQDSLTGNSGQDVFVFDTPGGTPDVTPDRILDFEAAGSAKGDIIDLSGIDADGNNGTQDSFLFNQTGLAGLSIVDDAFGNTLVRMNIDNDPRFEAIALISDGGVLASSYTAADFIL